jgi:hypothetical protein
MTAKVVSAGNRDKVKYSIHDSRTPASYFGYLLFNTKIR